MPIKRNRTPLKYIGYGLYLYFLGLSYRNTSKTLAQFVKRSHVEVWKWIQRYKPKKIARKRKRTSGFIIDETLVKIGSAYMWIWVAIELKSRDFRTKHIPRKKHSHCRAIYFKFGPDSGKHTVSTDRWRYLVSTDLQVSKPKTPYPLLSGEKSDRENDAVH